MAYIFRKLDDIAAATILRLSCRRQPKRIADCKSIASQITVKKYQNFQELDFGENT